MALWHSGVRPTQAIMAIMAGQWQCGSRGLAVSLGVPLPVALSVRVDWQ